jgi:hypothetical protein
VDLNNDGNTRNDFAPGTTRNQYTLPAYSSLDLRIARLITLVRSVKLQPIFEVYNLMNADNINTVNTTLYGVAGTTLTPNASFGQPLATTGQRIIQLALKVVF